jgi:hypothetical protein
MRSFAPRGSARQAGDGTEGAQRHHLSSQLWLARASVLPAGGGRERLHSFERHGR